LEETEKEVLVSTISDDDLDMKDVQELTHAERIQRLHQQRIQNYLKEEAAKMPFADKAEIKDPLAVAEYSQKNFENMKDQEQEYMVDPNYISKVQTEIRDTSRAFLIEWIIDVHRKFRLKPECLYVTTHIIDQFLSRKKIHKNQLHLLGVATLLISSKYEEIYPPDLRDLLAISENKFNRDQVIQMEKEILNTLSFKITAPSAYRFLERYKRLSKVYADKEVFCYAQYI